MQKIYRFELVITDEQVITMPAGSKILPTVQVREGKVVIWAVCTPSDKTGKVTIFIFGTGNSIPDEITDKRMKYLGTFQKDWFVGHVFAKI